MKIIYKNKEITSCDDWRDTIFLKTNKAKHWKKGRSAYSLADFIMNENGEEIIKNKVADILSEKITFNEAFPEYEVRFDKFGHGREHDLGIFGTTESGKSVFIGLEAKVDETFGDKISDAYIKAKVKELNKEATNAPERIENLLTKHFKKITKSIFDLPYQLLFSTVGTISEKADIHILFVIVFETKSYNIEKGKSNYKDYVKFFNKLDAKELKSKEKAYKVNIDGKELISVYMSIP